MTRLHIDAFTEGLLVGCENCTKTGTVQEDGVIPRGWWMLLDHTREGGLFCSIECIYHKVSELAGNVSRAVVIKGGSFNEVER